MTSPIIRPPPLLDICWIPSLSHSLLITGLALALTSLCLPCRCSPQVPETTSAHPLAPPPRHSSIGRQRESIGEWCRA